MNFRIAVTGQSGREQVQPSGMSLRNILNRP